MDLPLRQAPRPMVQSMGHHGDSNPRKIQEMLLADIWQKIQSAELAILSSVSLQNLVEQHQKLEHQHSLMYHI